MRLLLLLAAALAASSAMADGCPVNSEPYKQVTQGDVVTVRCRCIQGYANWRGECRPVEEVRTRLEERLENAQAGGRAALYAWSQQAQGAMLTKVRNALLSVDALQGLHGEALAKQSAEAELHLTEVLAGIRSCDFAEADLRVSCQNVKTFQHLVSETRSQIDKLSSQ